MIEYLTEEQQSKLNEYRERYTAIGLDTNPTSDDEVRRIATAVCRDVLSLKLPVVVVDSPLSCCYTIESLISCYYTTGSLSVRSLESNYAVKSLLADPMRYLSELERDSISDSIWESVRNSAGNLVRSSVTTLVKRSLRKAVESSVVSSIIDLVKSSVLAPICASVDSSVKDSVRASLRDSGTAVGWPYIDGHWWSYFFAYYDYMHKVLLVQGYPCAYNTLHETLNIGLLYPLHNVCVVGNKPIAIKRKEALLHCDGAPAVEYRDGFKIWALNGVSVPAWLAESKWNDIDCRKFAKITNAEVRREFVRKVGVERIAVALKADIIDKQGNYELLTLDLGGTTGKWPYLKMLNPSISVWHMECVGRECRTVQQALNFRASQLNSLTGDWTPEALT